MRKVNTDFECVVVGAGIIGLSIARSFSKRGVNVLVLEKNKKFGGLLRYGIPDFKMEKSHIDRRIEQMTAEGVKFHNNIKNGVNMNPSKGSKFI